jgi:small neutral amino acid transporter SnatA (MarC family)
MVNFRAGLPATVSGTIRKITKVPRGRVLLGLAILAWVILIGLVALGAWILHLWGLGVPSTR